MLGSFTLGAATLGGLVTTTLTPFVPTYTRVAVGDVAIMQMNGDFDMDFVMGDISIQSFDDSIEFI